MISIGVIGFGYWGPNIVRNFSSVKGARVVAVCDRSPEQLKKIALQNPDIRVFSDTEELLKSGEIDAVAIVTPVSTHYDITRRALENGKHVFVEKPFTQNSIQAQELIEIAESKNLKIMVDHTFLFTGAVRKIKQLVDEGELGKIYYYDSVRVNLGLFQHDVNVVWDLAPHDFSIMSYLINQPPLALMASGRSHVSSLEDIAYITVYFESNIIAHFSVNWLSPVKVRTTLIGGEKKMLVWNDLSADEKLKIYDKGVEIKNTQGIYDLLVSYRSGDMYAPKVEQAEALKLECEHFVKCIEESQIPLNNGYTGLEVVKMLEACDRSLKADGRLVEIGSSGVQRSLFVQQDDEGRRAA